MSSASPDASEGMPMASPLPPAPRYPCRVPYDPDTRARWLQLTVPQAEYEERLARVRLELARLDLDGLLVVGNLADPAGIAYLTNYTPRFGNSWLLVPLDGEPVFSSDAILHGEPMHSLLWNVWLPDVRPAAARADQSPGMLPQLIGAAARELGLANSRLGVASPATMGVTHADALRKELPDVTWCDGSAAILRPRAIKSEAEIGLMRRACEISAVGLDTAIAALRPGVSEREVANLAHAAMFRAGAEELGFDTAVSSGPRAGLKHAAPTERRLQGGELVFLDMGAVVGGYHADLSRCAGVWPIDLSARCMLDAAQAIFEDALAAVRPGNCVRDIYRAAEAAAVREGVADEYMPHGLGHGLGLSLFELPWLTPDDETPLAAGMIFALEPMLVRYGVGTAVIEETVLVTRSGAEVLSGRPW
jgi:Xaa-Pro aminopeptidase